MQLPVFLYSTRAYVFVAVFLQDKKGVFMDRWRACSALIKSIRLGREDDAVYWAVVLKGVTNPWFTMRRVVFSAGEDNVNLFTWKQLWEEFLSGQYDIARAAAMVAVSAQKCSWYTCNQGLDSIKKWLEASKRTGIPWSPELLKNEEDFLTWFLHEDLKVALPLSISALAEAKKDDTNFMEILEIGRKTIKDSVKYKDANGIAPIICWFFHGIVNEEVVLNENIIRKPEEEAMRDLASGNFRPVPSWALDGIHTSSGKDKRFAGTWQGIALMIRMGEKYGRLSPDLEI